MLYKLHIAHIVYCVATTLYIVQITHCTLGTSCPPCHAISKTAYIPPCWYIAVIRRRDIHTSTLYTPHSTLPRSTSEQRFCTQCVEIPGRLSHQLPKIKERVKIASDDTEFEVPGSMRGYKNVFWQSVCESIMPKKSLTVTRVIFFLLWQCHTW